MEHKEKEVCDCEKMACKENCSKYHTHKTFWCEKCHPERYVPSKVKEEEKERKCCKECFFETRSGLVHCTNIAFCPCHVSVWPCSCGKLHSNDIPMCPELKEKSIIATHGIDITEDHGGCTLCGNGFNEKGICDNCAPSQPIQKEWAEKFDKKFCGSKTYFYFARRPDEIKSFIRQTLQAQKEKILEIAAQMKKEVCGCEEDKDPQAPGYHTKECNLEPYGYNTALSDLQDRVRKI